MTNSAKTTKSFWKPISLSRFPGVALPGQRLQPESWRRCGVQDGPSKVLTMEDLDHRPGLQRISMMPRGLVLVTGPTGSGKSTTLAAMIDFINDNRYDHILTIEDPIEFVHESKKCLVNQREVHRDTHGFNEALRSALREDPDIILVGEMRDLETIRLALTAAETGHLVFGTLHTTSAAKTIDRISTCFPLTTKTWCARCCRNRCRRLSPRR